MHIEQLEHEVCERCGDQFEWDANYGDWLPDGPFSLEQQQGIRYADGTLHIWCDDCIIQIAQYCEETDEYRDPEDVQ